MKGRKRGIFLFVIVTVLGLAFFVRQGEAQKSKAPNAPAGKHAQLASNVPVVGRAVGFAETKPMRELTAIDVNIDPQLKQEAEEINELNVTMIARPNPNAPVQRDGALQSSFGPEGQFKLNIPAPILTFEGLGVNGSAPPDTTGAVGPNDYVEAVNGGGIRVYDKSGNPRGPAFKLSSLFAPLGGVAASTDNGDALVLYDRIANRWLITQFAFTATSTPPYHQPIAVSKTSDPTGAYWVYDFITPGNLFPDYGKIGTWSDGYYFTDRQFVNGGAYVGFGVFAFDRAKMLVGDSTASYIYFNAGPNLSNSSSGMIPSDFNGLTPPPPGAPNVFSVFNDDSSDDATDSLRLFDFHADFVTPANSTFIERPESPLLVAAFDSRSPNGRAHIEQPPPAVAADNLDSIGDRLMLRLQYLNRGGVEQLTTCHTVNAGVLPPPGINPTATEYKAGTRYYVLQKTSPSGAYSVLDQATYAPDANERWIGSTALDNAGNLAVGYSISSTAVFPSIAYAGRLATDPPGTLAQGEATMFAGTGVQQATSNRWGDYTNMSLDPADDATFWYANQYYSVTGQFLWRTRIGAFKFAATTAPPQGTLNGTITACDTGAVLKDAFVQVSGGPSSGFSSATMPNGTYSMKLSPGNYSVTVSDPAHKCTAIGPFNVTITNGGTTTLNKCLSGTATFVYQSSAVSVSGGNGNGIIEPNECNNVSVSITNDGCILGTNITATLSSTTPGVTVTQPNSPYPNVNEGATAANNIPFAVSTSNAFICGTNIDFVLTISFSGGTSAFAFSLPTCLAPAVTINGALTSGDLQQPVGRLGRNAIASACGTLKACPGPLGAGPRLYDQYTFTNGPAPACVRIDTTQSCPTPANDIIPAAYLGSYDPNNFCTNYLGDPGGSPGTTGNSMSVDVPANATLVVVIQEANAGLPGCSGYSFTVSGLIGNGVGTGPCAPAPSVVSRKTHAGAGTFDIPLPLTGPVGVEDRVGNAGVAGIHTVVLSYTTNPAGATATVVAHNPSAATGSVSGVSFSGNDMIVNLTGVSDKQVLQLSITGGSVSPTVVPIGFLVGDVNNNRSVSGTDVAQTKAAASSAVNASTFRADVNVNGVTNGTDVSLVKADSGNALP